MPESKKVVIKVDIHDEKGKRQVLKAVASLSGIESVAMDMKERKLTLIGDIDPVEAVKKLKKWHTELLTVGPAKEPEKKPEDKKKEEAKKKEEEEAFRKWLATYGPYYNPYMIPQYCVHSIEDYPNNNCVIS